MGIGLEEAAGAVASLGPSLRAVVISIEAFLPTLMCVFAAFDAGADAAAVDMDPAAAACSPTLEDGIIGSGRGGTGPSATVGATLGVDDTDRSTLSLGVDGNERTGGPGAVEREGMPPGVAAFCGDGGGRYVVLGRFA